MTSTLFIINPKAGAGRAARVWDGLREELLKELPDAACARTEGPGHATELARDAVTSGASRIVAVGGDGTFSEVLEGYMRAPEEARRAAALATIPAGSGCDLARHFACPKDRRELINLIARGRRRPVDVGRVRCLGLDGSDRERYFMNIAAFGTAGEVAHHVHRMGKGLGGKLSYALSSVRVLLTTRARDLKLNADGRDLSGRYHMGVLANTSTMGGGMRIAPLASHDDGELELVLVGDMGRFRLLRNFPKLYSGTHLGEDGVSLFRVRKLTAASDETVYLNIDGEADGVLPASFEVLPHAATILLPEPRDRRVYSAAAK